MQSNNKNYKQAAYILTAVFAFILLVTFNVLAKTTDSSTADSINAEAGNKALENLHNSRWKLQTRAASSNGNANIPKTGDTYDDPCCTGEDGDLQKGVEWPDPRFTDNNDGTVTDNLTKLIWLKNADCWEPQSWPAALASANNLASGACGLTDNSIVGDWRLPNLRELNSLVHYGFYNPALPNTVGTGQWSEGDPFTGVQPYSYWSSTSLADDPASAWCVVLAVGSTSYDYKSSNHDTWVVKDVPIFDIYIPVIVVSSDPPPVLLSLPSDTSVDEVDGSSSRSADSRNTLKIVVPSNDIDLNVLRYWKLQIK